MHAAHLNWERRKFKSTKLFTNDTRCGCFFSSCTIYFPEVLGIKVNVNRIYLKMNAKYDNNKQSKRFFLSIYCQILSKAKKKINGKNRKKKKIMNNMQCGFFLSSTQTLVLLRMTKLFHVRPKKTSIARFFLSTQSRCKSDTPNLLFHLIL